MPQKLTLQQQVDLQPLHTFALPSKANYFVTLTNRAQLEELPPLIKRLSLPVIILGGGSNTVFNDIIEALVVHVALRGIQLLSEDDTEVKLQVAAGENWHQLVQYCVDRGYGGIENLALIPGSVGAAPVQNIGAYGVELVNVIDCVEVFDLHQGKSLTLAAADCGFAYRDSIFKHPPHAGRYIITSIQLRLQKQPELHLDYGLLRQTLTDSGLPPSLQNVAAAVIKIRNSKLPDPKQLANAGSFFKNPVISTTEFKSVQQQHRDEIPHYPQSGNKVKIPAGWLIEQCSWKGKRIGGLGCYQHQALILVHYGGADGNSLKNLIQQIIDSVAAKFGLQLQPEVNLIGFTEQ